MAAMARTLIVITLLLLLSKNTMGLMSRNVVIIQLKPCLGFITANNPDPSNDCCAGVKNVVASVKTPADRQAICECIKSVLPKVPGYDPTRIPPLPKKCGLNINLPPIDQDTDCSRW